MFPTTDQQYITNEPTVQENSNVFNGKAFLYDYKKGDFVYQNGTPVVLEGKEALKAWIEKCLRTMKFKAIVHKDLDFGPQLEDLIGSSFDRDFVKAEIERECREALLANTYITRIDNFDFSFENDKLTANITISTVYDTIRMEVNM